MTAHTETFISGFLHAEIFVDGMIEFLPAAEGSAPTLNRCVAEQELYLLQFPTSRTVQTGACTTQVVRGKILDTGALCRGIHNMHIAFGVSPPFKSSRWHPRHYVPLMPLPTRFMTATCARVARRSLTNLPLSLAVDSSRVTIL
jgi:hypothetical protein